MIPDPDPSAVSGLTLDSRDPRIIPASDQMCMVEGETGTEYAQYNTDQCLGAAVPDPDDPDSEIQPQGQKQGNVDVNDTVRGLLSCKNLG